MEATSDVDIDDGIRLPDDGFHFEELDPKIMPEIRSLHDECFPIKYTDTFYKQLQSGPYFSVMIIHTDANDARQLAGFSSWKLEKRPRVWDSDRPSINDYDSDDSDYISRVGYLATFGIKTEFRQRGLGEVLLKESIRRMIGMDVVQIDLHVKADNFGAIRLYHKSGFFTHKELPKHYYFDGAQHDALYLVYKVPERRDSAIDLGYDYDDAEEDNNSLDYPESKTMDFEDKPPSLRTSDDPLHENQVEVIEPLTTLQKKKWYGPRTERKNFFSDIFHKTRETIGSIASIGSTSPRSSLSRSPSPRPPQMRSPFSSRNQYQNVRDSESSSGSSEGFSIWNCTLL